MEREASSEGGRGARVARGSGHQQGQTSGKIDSVSKRMAFPESRATTRPQVQASRPNSGALMGRRMQKVPTGKQWKAEETDLETHCEA